MTVLFFFLQATMTYVYLFNCGNDNDDNKNDGKNELIFFFLLLRPDI